MKFGLIGNGVSDMFTLYGNKHDLAPGLGKTIPSAIVVTFSTFKDFVTFFLFAI